MLHFNLFIFIEISCASKSLLMTSLYRSFSLLLLISTINVVYLLSKSQPFNKN